MIRSSLLATQAAGVLALSIARNWQGCRCAAKVLSARGKSIGSGQLGVGRADVVDAGLQVAHVRLARAGFSGDAGSELLCPQSGAMLFLRSKQLL